MPSVFSLRETGHIQKKTVAGQEFDNFKNLKRVPTLRQMLFRYACTPTVVPQLLEAVRHRLLDIMRIYHLSLSKLESGKPCVILAHIKVLELFQLARSTAL